jgi:ribosomal protein S18 acetylase RimI-like enzyme
MRGFAPAAVRRLAWFVRQHGDRAANLESKCHRGGRTHGRAHPSYFRWAFPFNGKIERLCVAARDAGSSLVGGLYGEMYWGWLHVLALWVAPPMRRQRLGTRLLARAEGEAFAKGCHGAYLDTFSFQSVGLYTRAGYQIFGSLEHYPAEHSRYFLRKALNAA